MVASSVSLRLSFWSTIVLLIVGRLSNTVFRSPAASA
ncbi:Uncharacterised protein [Mycobacterium tuberculosis]|uniref:Uncharacterized protein n=1 Tax=Mycobacterium tuberculosis TaxID=1773 RepID=A0A916PBH9_MYCTX|nr:Uncharacterised protein [Mycobacterium tuberculosis]COX20723.1 Uncharacterised protein [Mycobacterium tuberculosis]COX93115.1 Uncharacterised protein [Mycobacterium tuberculosis]CPA10011.1 Uncharacterised protein [Mycobacterium tuberculosis]